MSLEWTDIQRNKIALEQDLVLFDEAIECLKVRALRGAYVVSWLAIAESIKVRLREMAVRDGETQKIVGEIARREAAIS